MGDRRKKEIDGQRGVLNAGLTLHIYTIDFLASPSVELIISADQDLEITTNASFDDNPETAFIPSGTPSKLDNTIIDFSMENLNALVNCNYTILMKTSRGVTKVVV